MGGHNISVTDRYGWLEAGQNFGTTADMGAHTMALPLQRLSYSTLSKWDTCPSKVYLGKGTTFVQTPSWASVGGRAAHSLIEEYDREGVSRWSGPRWEQEATRIFIDAILTEEASSGILSSEWRASRGGAEGQEWWARKLPAMGEMYQAWRLANPHLMDWVTPDGAEAIELEIKVNIPGARLPFLAFVDKVMIDTSRADALVIVDYKSGSLLPEDLNQFHSYAALMEVRYGIRPGYGATYNARKGELHPLRKGGPTILPLNGVPTDVWIKGVQEREALMDLNLWPAKPGKYCGWCEVKNACVYGGGSQAMRFDPHHPRYKGSLGLAA